MRSSNDPLLSDIAKKIEPHISNKDSVKVKELVDTLITLDEKIIIGHEFQIAKN